ncbi:uncharacterized protein LOC141657584 [Silene latifolia]|uniref:uncharacterized protein LOC141657584 n=1 Tax=Silene latifolia TaxID=37657 RepID=UPI003D76C4D1
MKPQLLSSSHTLSSPIISRFSPSSLNISNSPNISRLFFKHHSFFPFSSSKTPHFFKICITDYSIKAQINPNSITEEQSTEEDQLQFMEIKNPNSPPFISSFRSKFSFSDQAFFLFTFIAFTTSAAFASFVAAAVPTLYAMGRAANSFAKLADAAREELPGTLAAVRLSGMEVSDLTLELTDLSQEISAGVNKSGQAVEAAKVGIQQIGARAREQTILMIEERANLPTISLQTVVSGAAKKTSRAVGRATRTFLNLISGGESNSEDIG